MAGAPVLSGVAGTGLAVLDILVNGFGLQTASSLVVSGGVATLTLPNGHSFEQDTVAFVAGVTPAELNGEKRIISTTSTSATFAALGIADQTATGTITAKVAGSGWEKVFSGTNVAVYRSPNLESSRQFLRVDDTSATNMRVVGYENMTDAVTGNGPFPTATQISGGGYWPKANASGATARAWTLIADSKGFLIHIHTSTTSPGVNGSVWGFGDFASLKSGDAYACALFCHNADASAASSLNFGLEYCSSPTPVAAAYFPRSFAALGGGIAGAHLPLEYFSGSTSGAAVGSVAFPTYPNGPNNSLALSKKALVEPSVCRRGFIRGLYVVPQNCHTSFSWRDPIDGQDELAGRKLRVIKCGSPAGITSQGMVVVDITGPW